MMGLTGGLASTSRSTGGGFLNFGSGEVSSSDIMRREGGGEGKRVSRLWHTLNDGYDFFSDDGLGG